MAEKNIKNKIIKTLTFDILSNLSSNYEDVELTLELKKEMYNDITINMAINTLLKGVSSRELIIKSEKNIANDKKIREIQERFNKINNKTAFVTSIAKAVFFGMSLNEIVYNEDYSIKKFEEIPVDLIEYKKDEKKWRIKAGSEYIDITGNEKKWLFSIYNQSIEHFYGESKLKSLFKTYNEIKNVKKKLNGIVEKYGDIIVVFGYSPDSEEKEIEKTANEIREMSGRNVIALPMDGNLYDNIQFIKMSELGTEIHNQLIEKYENKIISNLLGGNLTVSNGQGKGSYALGDIHQEEKEKIEDEIALFVRDEMDKVLKIDAEFFGYNAEEYYISLDREEKETEILAIEKLKQENRNLKVEEILKLKQAGYEIDENELKEMFDYKTLKKVEEEIVKQEFEEKKLSIAERQIKIDEYVNKLASDYANEQGENLKK